MVNRTGNRRTHGGSGGKDALYMTWQGMRRRCLSRDAHNWEHYGGRGITICDAWLDFGAFRDWISEHLGPRPTGFTLDRIDNDLGYAPGNVRWSNASVQQLNSRKARLLTHPRTGETLHLTEWGRKLRIRSTTIAMRIDRRGWDVARALDEPVHDNGYRPPS